MKLDNILAQHIPRWKNDVLKKDRDKILIVDGREGSGKSSLAQQIAINLDPSFNMDKIAFTADQFMAMVKDPKRKKGDCIILDEAFLAANSRSAMSQINRAMVGLATEMRQLNLFIIICLPSFFDLDKYFALWRSDLLIHTYFDKKGNRGRFIMWGSSKKKNLYLLGKKFYNYSSVRSPYPPCRFSKGYVVDEEEYRLKKAQAFREEKTSPREKTYKNRLIDLYEWLHKDEGYSWEEIGRRAGISSSSVRKLVSTDRAKLGDGFRNNINTILPDKDVIHDEVVANEKDISRD